MPNFLSVDDVLAIHRDQLHEYGGQGGVLNRGLLESAVAMPEAGMGGQYFHADLYEMAAAYLFHLVKNHPFNDGNKRVAAMAAFTFLKINGLFLDAPEEPFYALTISAAEGRATKATIAEFFRRFSSASP